MLVWFSYASMIRNVRQLCIRIEQIRHINTSSAHKLRYTPKDNPGVYRRLKVISEDEPDIEKAGLDYDSIENLEQDFMQADDMHDDIMDQMKRISKTKQLKMIERRHFRSPKEPGMLTWSEKEQIRYLHQSDPEKWTAEILAESFPASPTIIKKILKWKWKPENAERLKAHDRRVSENWKAFHKGQLEVHDLRLKAHLAKFTDRKDGVKIASDEEAAKLTEVFVPKPKYTEFVSIIKSFNNEKTFSNKTEVQQIEINGQNTKQIEKTNLSHRFDGPKLKYTLDQYRTKLGEDSIKTMDSSQEEIKAIIGNKKQTIAESNQSSEMYVAPSERYKTDAIAYQPSVKSPLKLINMENQPNWIKIPKEEWKKGSLYKLNDCFYDDKGQFLYRVPGLKS